MKTLEELEKEVDELQNEFYSLPDDIDSNYEEYLHFEIKYLIEEIEKRKNENR